ncbi:Uncharacterised protein [uncultured archaeon]|nr:Uncharacterised protein [uncultured archaeon]
MADTIQEIKEDRFSKDNVTHLLALVIVVGVMGLYVKHLWWTPTAEDLKAVEATGTYLGSTIALVLGYYFGSAVGEKQAKTAEKDKNLAKQTMSNELDDLKAKLDSRLKEIKDLKTDIQNIIGTP